MSTEPTDQQIADGYQFVHRYIENDYYRDRTAEAFAAALASAVQDERTAWIQRCETARFNYETERLVDTADVIEYIAQGPAR